MTRGAKVGADERPRSEGADVLLEVTDLRAAFRAPDGPARAVDGVSFQLRAGEAVGLVGESGSGKTVTALSLLGLLPRGADVAAESSIRFRGTELVGADASTLRSVRGRGVGMVFQDPGAALNPVLSVGDQVAESLTAQRTGERAMDRRRVRERTVTLLDEVGIPDPEEAAARYPHQLSGGQRQRVVLAMALAMEPDLLVADEPTSALDVTVQAQLLDLLDGRVRRQGTALLFISHDLAVVARLCDRVLVMYAGRIVEEGSVEEVLRAPRHPYTAGLIAAAPALGGSRGLPRAIPGSVPEATDRPEGCRFRPRCPHAWERCRQEPPLLEVAAESPDGAELRTGGASRRSRCWLEEEPDRRERP